MSEENINNNKDFEAIYRTYYKKMFGICLKYVHNDAVAEDLLQDAFIVVINKLPTLEDKSKIESWISSIVRNTCITYLRKKALFSNISLSQDVQSDNSLTEAQTEETITYDALADMVEQLPEGYRKVFKLAVFDGLSHKEIAKILNISPNTSASQLARAKKVLKYKVLAYWTLAVLPVLLVLVFIWEFWKHSAIEENISTQKNEIVKPLKHSTDTGHITLYNKTNRRETENLTEKHEETNSVVIVEDTDMLLSQDKERETEDYMEEKEEEIYLSEPITQDFDYEIDDVLKTKPWFVGFCLLVGGMGSEITESYLFNEGYYNSFVGYEETYDIETKCYRPVTLNLMVDKYINRFFSFGFGGVYTFLETDYLFNGKKYATDEVQYLGLKTELAYHWFRRYGMDAYISLGAAMEVPVYSKTYTYFDDKPAEESLDAFCQFSSGIALGMSLELGYGIQVFAEPSLTYYFENKDGFSHFRKEHPWNINIPIGIRIRLAD